MDITRIDPPCWFANMNDNVLQLLVYGSDLLDVRVDIEYQVELDSSIVSNNCNYLIVNVDTSNVKPNTSCTLLFQRNGNIIRKEYKFFPRRNKRIELLSMKDAIYLLMPDRYAVGDRKRGIEKFVIDKDNPDCWHGGTINGMTSHIDDIANMGFTAIWHTPVFENRQNVASNTQYYNYHGYAITDFYAIDPHFGSIQDYCEFVDTAHKKSIKVMMDMVFNHCGIDHPFVKDPPVECWFNRKGCTNYSPLTEYDRHASVYDREHFVRGWFTENMPDINLSNNIVLDYMTQMSIWWIETTDIDAFRVDTYPYAGTEYMQKWQRRLYAEYPQFPILAEAWVGETEYVAKMQSNNLAEIPESTMSFMDFAFQRRLSDTPLGNKGREVYTHFALDFAYKNPQNLLAFIDNHDVARWLSKHPSIAELKQAIGLLLTIPRIPQIYYGTEVLLAGKGKGDGNMRQDYPWDKPLSTEKQDFKTSISKLLKWRKGCKAITEGEMIHFVPLDNAYVYFRYLTNDNGYIDKSEPIVMVMLNFSDKKVSVDTSRFEEIITEHYDICEVWGNYKCSDIPTTSISIDAHDIIIIELKNHD